MCCEFFQPWLIELNDAFVHFTLHACLYWFHIQPIICSTGFSGHESSITEFRSTCTLQPPLVLFNRGSKWPNSCILRCPKNQNLMKALNHDDFMVRGPLEKLISYLVTKLRSWNPTIKLQVPDRQVLDSVLALYSLTIHFNIILPPMPQVAFHWGFPNQNVVSISQIPQVCYMPK